MYSRDTACRVRFTVSGCVSCGGWFIADTAEPCPYGNALSDFVVSVYCGHETSPPQAVPLSFQERHYVPTNHFQISSVGLA